MRWEALFDDLEAQVEALERAELTGAVDERTRGETAVLSVLDRLRASVGEPVQVRCGPGPDVNGTLQRLGPDWLLIDLGGGREALVLLAALSSVRGLGRAAEPGRRDPVAARLGVRHALRGLARDRLPVRLQLRDGSFLEATVDRVGADYVEVATHAPGEPRRRGLVRQLELIPLASLAAVWRRR